MCTCGKFFCLRIKKEYLVVIHVYINIGFVSLEKKNLNILQEICFENI